MDLILTIAIASIVFVTSGLGGHLASTKPWHKWVFWGLGFLALMLIIVQATLNAHEKPLTLNEAQDLFRKATNTNSLQVPPSTDDANKPITKAEFLKLIQRYQSSQSSTHDLRQKEYNLAKQLRQSESDYAAIMKSIEDRCKNIYPAPRPGTGLSCGIADKHNQTVAFENARHNYRGQSLVLRDAMLAKLPPQGPQPDMEDLGLSGLADYLDGLASRLP